MHLFHPTHGIKKYASAEDILQDFFELRAALYKKRKAYMKKELTHRMELLSNKAKFVKMVVDDEIVVFKKKRAELEAAIAAVPLPKVDDSYDYLLNIKTYQYTEEAIADMFKASERARLDLAELEGTTIAQMWQRDVEKIAV